MASLTVRKLDEKLKKLLRLRAARNGRSVEDEVRVILRQAAEEAGREALDLINPPNPSAQPAPRQARTDAAVQRVLLIIGGGIAAYKALDLIRRLKERRSRSLRPDRGGAALRHTAHGQRAADERCYTDLFDPESEFDAGHIRLAREADLIVVAPATADLMAKMAQGSADDLASAILLATDAPILLRAGNESADVEQCRDTTQCRDASTRRHLDDRTQCRRDGRGRRSRNWPDGRTAGNCRRRRTRCCARHSPDRWPASAS